MNSNSRERLPVNTSFTHGSDDSSSSIKNIKNKSNHGKDILYQELKKSNNIVEKIKRGNTIF